jgi:hypothetical protein
MTFWTDVAAVLDADGNVISPAIPAPPPVDQDAVRPNVDDVGVLSRTRTVDETTGSEVGSFTESTRPSASEVEDLIDTASADVLSQLPPNLDPVWYGAISRAIALRAAFTLEASFYREAASVNVGPAAEYGQRFSADLAALQALIPKATYVA